MKILKDQEYDLLTQKAANYDAVVSAMVQAGSDISAEDITVQSILEAMEPQDAAVEDTSAADALNQTIADLNSQINVLNERAVKAEARVTELEGLPADDSVGGKDEIIDEDAVLSIDELNKFVKNNDFSASIDKVRTIL